MNRTTFEPGPLAHIECRPSGDRWTLVFVRDLRHPPEKVWAALTDPAQLREWSPFIADRDLGRPGGATLTMIDGEHAEDLPATVTRAEPPTLLEYTWGKDLLRWELAPKERGTRLTLQHTIEDRDWVPKVAAGWHICLVVAERLLDGDANRSHPGRGRPRLRVGRSQPGVCRSAWHRDSGIVRRANLSRSAPREEELELEGAVAGDGEHRQSRGWVDPVVGQGDRGAAHDDSGVALQLRL